MADMLDFSAVQQKATTLETRYRARNTMFDELERMFLMKWDGPDSEVDDLKLTISPSARNAALGAIRLMTTADPEWSVPWEINDEAAREKSEATEKFAKALWYASGRIRQRPLHYDAVTSAVLFGEVHLGMSLSSDLKEIADGGDPSAAVRLERSLSSTPLLFEVFDPRTGFPELDSYGLSSYARKVKVKAGEILDKWGQLALDANLDPENRDADVEYWDYWDYIYHVVWISGASSPLYNGPHGLGTIPVVCYITDGSLIHSAEDDKRQPFLYTLWRSKLWDRENLSLTYIYDNIAKMGLSPTFKHKKADENDELFMDNSIQGGVVSSRGDVTPLPKTLIDPAVKEALAMGGELVTKSTITDQALGMPVGANTPFSALSLLSQAGSKPLVGIQRLCSEAFGKAMETGFFILRERGGKLKAAGKDGVLSLDVRKEVPENLVIISNLDISMPSDNRENAMVAMQAVQSGLVTKRYAREYYLKIGQSKDMENQILQEKLDDLTLQMEFQREQAKLTAELQSQGLPTGQPGPAGPQTPAPQAPGGPQMSPPTQANTGDIPPTDISALMGGGGGPAEGMIPGDGLPAMPLSGPKQPTNVPGGM